MNLQTLESVLAKDTFTDEDLLAFLSLTDTECCARLWREAYDRTTRVHGNALWFRGLIEISNYCIYDCPLLRYPQGQPSGFSAIR